MPRLCAILLLGLSLVSASTPASSEPASGSGEPPIVRTGKERLGEKATDEQRVTDCKVPPQRRTRTRPTGCSAP
jgi:hypothetical protein